MVTTEHQPFLAWYFHYFSVTTKIAHNSHGWTSTNPILKFLLVWTNPSKHCTGIIPARYRLFCQNGTSAKLFSGYQGHGHLLLCTPPFWWAVAVNCYPTGAQQSFNSCIRYSLEAQYHMTQYVTVLLHCYPTSMVPVKNCLAVTKVTDIALHTAV